MTIRPKSYNFLLPEKLVAKVPANPRNHCRLLVYKTNSDEIIHEHFYNLGRYLDPKDLLIFNNSRVFPARLYGQKENGGKVEILLLEEKGRLWQALVGGKVVPGQRIVFDRNLNCVIRNKNGKKAEINFDQKEGKFWRTLDQIGHMPIPPYIKDTKLSERALREKYQTVYARASGSAAAPTAGLHFTKKLIGELECQGIESATIDLHVGLGTFAPVSEENIRQKKLYPEKFSIPYSTVEKIRETRRIGSKIVAVGTTTVRALESASQKILSHKKEISDSTDIFIQSGYKFKIVDELITNFHLPCSSLMMLVAAFLQHKGVEDGRKKLLELYKIAINKKYRFYSFGDAMLIL